MSVHFTPIADYRRSSFAACDAGGRRISHDIYHRGSGAPVVIIQELPGIGPETLRLADEFVARAFEVVIPHLFGTTAFQEVSWPMATTVWAAERLIPVAYRRAWFHAISESTRDDLVARGIPADRIAVVHPGVDAERYAPDPAVERADPPRFVYLGRLKRYKGVEHLLRALALARRERGDLSLDIAGSGEELAALFPHGRFLPIPGRDHMKAVGDRRHIEGVIEFLAEQLSDLALISTSQRRREEKLRP